VSLRIRVSASIVGIDGQIWAEHEEATLLPAATGKVWDVVAEGGVIADTMLVKAREELGTQIAGQAREWRDRIEEDKANSDDGNEEP
jgi:hypothetical protein